MRATRLVVVVVVGCLGFVAAVAVPAGATFPGANGKIGYWKSVGDGGSLRTIDDDGTDGAVLWPADEVLGGRWDRAFAWDLEWSADGERIAYVARARTLGHDRVLIGEPGTTERTVIFEPSSIDDHTVTISISLSPAGDRLMLCLAFLHRANTTRLYTLDIDGSDLQLVADASRCFGEWNAAGRVVATAGAEHRRLITMEPDGSDVRAVVSERHSLLWPSWAPDGSKIVYAKAMGMRGRYDLFSVGADGTNRIRLTRTSRRDEAWPIYSPDGAHVVYSRSKEYWGHPSDLFSLSVADGVIRRLTDTPRAYEEPRSFQPITLP